MYREQAAANGPCVFLLGLIQGGWAVGAQREGLPSEL